MMLVSLSHCFYIFKFLFSEVFEKNIVPANKQDAVAAIHAEMADIRSKAIANGTYMKAPNGEKSNLNEAHGYM